MLRTNAMSRLVTSLLKGCHKPEQGRLRHRPVAIDNYGAQARGGFQEPGGIWPNPAPEGHATGGVCCSNK
jgi:hypothetical protein